MSIQKTVLYIAIVMLILALVFIGYMMYKAKSTSTFPPEIAECPDYWKVVGIEKCENTMNLGTCQGVHDFSGPEWQGNAGLKKKSEWARGCGIVWDGVTNNTSVNTI
jgi:hypothetical protein